MDETNQQREITAPSNHCVIPLEPLNIHHGALLLARRLGENQHCQNKSALFGGFLEWGIPKPSWVPRLKCSKFEWSGGMTISGNLHNPSHNFDYHANRLGNCSDKPISTSFQPLKEHSTSRLSPRASVKNVGTKTMVSNYQLGSTTSNHVKPIAMAPVPTGKFERTKTEKLGFKKQKTNCVRTIMICVT